MDVDEINAVSREEAGAVSGNTSLDLAESHLEAALEEETDPETRDHIRSALQLLLIEGDSGS